MDPTEDLPVFQVHKLKDQFRAHLNRLGKSEGGRKLKEHSVYIYTSEFGKELLSRAEEVDGRPMISVASLVKLSSVCKGYKGPLLSFIERKREDRRRVLAKEASSSLQDEPMFGEQASVNEEGERASAGDAGVQEDTAGSENPYGMIPSFEPVPGVAAPAPSPFALPPMPGAGSVYPPMQPWPPSLPCPPTPSNPYMQTSSLSPAMELLPPGATWSPPPPMQISSRWVGFADMPSEAVSASIASRFEEIREHSSDTKRRRMEELYPKGYLIAVTTTPAASDIGLNPKLAENMELVIENLKYGSWKERAQPDHLFLISLSPPKVPLGQVLQGVSRQALKVLDLKREVLLPRVKEVFAKATRTVYPWTWPILLQRFTNDRSLGAVDELIKRLAEVMRGPQELDELPAREAVDVPEEGSEAE